MNEQNTQLAKNKSNADMYLPTTKNEAFKLAESFSKSGFCPSAYRGKPADVYLAMAYGAQIGLNPLLAVQNIAVVNGKPSVYGDALTAIAQGHPETEVYEDGYREDGTAFCRIVRQSKKGRREVYREFSVEMAKKAGLWGRNTWAQYPERMLLWRARGYAVRDIYADALMGLVSFEEAQDQPSQPMDRDVTPPAQADSSEAPAPKKKSSKADAIKNKVKPQEEAVEIDQEADSESQEEVILTPPEPIENEEVYEPSPEELAQGDSFFFGEDA